MHSKQDSSPDPTQLEKEAKLRTVIESVPNGIIMVDETGTIALCNSEAEGMFGFERNELLGMPIEILVPSKVQVDRLCPSVVIMDVNMPKMNGIEATVKIKTSHPDMVVIGLAVNDSSENQNAMRAAGASVLLNKAAAVEQLHQSIQEAMRRRLRG